MEITETSKIIFGVVAAVGVLVMAFLNMEQAKKTKSELIEKFELALVKAQKLTVAELFRLIFGLRMNYSDIVELVKNDDCLKIIYALKKTPGYVCYENGVFKYTGIGKSRMFHFADKWLTKLGILFLTVLLIVAYSMVVFGDGAMMIGGFILTVVFAAMLGVQIRKRRYDSMVATLVNRVEPV